MIYLLFDRLKMLININFDQGRVILNCIEMNKLHFTENRFLTVHYMNFQIAISTPWD